VLSLAFYWRAGARWWLFAALFLVPDVAMLFYLSSQRAGSTAYNVVHSYVLPLAVLTVAVFSHQNAMSSLALIWTAHIGFDRALGYGLKYPGSFVDTHLGSLKRTR
jgi:hypothetical protein